MTVTTERTDPTDAIDLDAYLARIGMVGERPAPDLSSLAELVRRHAAAIAFENVDQFCGVPCPLSPAALETKLVRARRGGWCFEQNLLLMDALRQIGYRVSGLAARVTWMRAAELPVPARTHMLVRVDLPEGPHVVDVGFGGLTVTAPVALDPATVQHTPHEPVRIISLDSGYELEVLVGGRWTALYRFTLDEQFLADYELASWYLATHPESRFVQSLMAARPDDDRRYSLQNTTLTTHPLEGGPPDRRQLADVDELLGVLRETFLLEVVATPEVVRGLERLFRPG